MIGQADNQRRVAAPPMKHECIHEAVTCAGGNARDIKLLHHT